MGGSESEESPGLVRVLVVVDDPINRDVATSMLALIQCQASEARNGYEAVECYADNSFDLILMDCHMPKLDGYSATRLIREIESESERRVPIVALIASASSEVQQQCVDAGMDDCLCMPFTLDSLRDKVIRWAGIKDEHNNHPDPIPRDLDTLKNTISGTRICKVTDACTVDEILDPGVLEELRTLEASGSSDMFIRVINLYIASSPELVESLKTACYANNYEEIRLSAHALKSSSNNVGAISLACYLSELEGEAREQMIEDIDGRLAKILHEYGLVISALGKELAL